MLTFRMLVVTLSMLMLPIGNSNGQAPADPADKLKVIAAQAGHGHRDFERRCEGQL
jgi:hypothetical protein